MNRLGAGVVWTSQCVGGWPLEAVSGHSRFHSLGGARPKADGRK